MEERAYSVSIDTWGEGVDTVKDDAMFELTDILGHLGVHGVSISAGGLSGGIGATFSVDVAIDGDEARALGEAVAHSVGIFNDACMKVGVHHGGISRIDTVDERLADLDLNQEPETFVGVSELASTLGVSRQRVSELRTREDFPAPIAELAAGPVWRMSSLRSFIKGWERKPGRPRKVTA